MIRLLYFYKMFLQNVLTKWVLQNDFTKRVLQNKKYAQ